MMNFSHWEKDWLLQGQDVIIVGGGFTGLATGIHLLEKSPKLRVLVIEKQHFSRAASTRNAGFACFGSPSEILSDAKTMGWEKTTKLLLMRYQGLQQWRKWFGDGLIDYVNCGGFEVFSEGEMEVFKEYKKRLSEINTQLDDIGKNVFLTKETSHFKGFKYCFENKYEGRLHPMKLLQTCKKRLTELGGVLLENCEAKQYEDQFLKVKINGNEANIQSKHLVITNNAFAQQFSSELGLQKEDVLPARAQVLLTEPLSLNWDGVYHYMEGYYYFRRVGGRILIGGARNEDPEGETTFSANTSELIQNHIEKVLFEQILGKKCNIEMRWSGTMALGSHKFPIIRSLDNNVYCGVRMGGMGVALSAEIGKLIANKITA